MISEERNFLPSRGALPPSLLAASLSPLAWLTKPNPTEPHSLSPSEINANYKHSRERERERKKDREREREREREKERQRESM